MSYKYRGYEIKRRWVEDESQFWFWTEFEFEDEQGEIWFAKSPVYEQCGSDFYCLFEDTRTINQKLEEGESWEALCRDFRQSW